MVNDICGLFRGGKCTKGKVKQPLPKRNKNGSVKNRLKTKGFLAEHRCGKGLNNNGLKTAKREKIKYG